MSEDSVVSTIEKIKLQEQEKEVKLKEKREYETSITMIQRNIRDTMTQNDKLLSEEKILSERIHKLVSQMELEKIKHKSLTSQAEVLKIEHEDLKDNINANISNVWEIRSKFCEAVKQTSDEYDVWPLLMKPACSVPIMTIKTPEKEIVSNGSRLKDARERRENGIAERNRLLAEPDTGEEFVRGYTRTCKNRFFCNKPDIVKHENAPIKFTTSAASKSRTMPIINKHKLKMPWYQPYSVVGSIAAFLIYFCVLREESDLDAEFEKTLYDRLEGLEKQQLLLSYRFNKENGKSVVEIEQRLKEIEEEEQRKAIA